MKAIHRPTSRNQHRSRARLAFGLSGAVLLVGGVLAPPAQGSIEKLESTAISMMTVLLNAYTAEGMQLNLGNYEGVLPEFHSVQWNPSTRNLNWRFLIPAEGELFTSLQTLSLPQAVARLKEKMEELAALIGLVPIQGLEEPVGLLDAFTMPGQDRLSEADWHLARKQLAEASVVHLAAPHKDGPIFLTRQPNGRVIETRAPQPAAKPAAPNKLK